MCASAMLLCILYLCGYVNYPVYILFSKSSCNLVIRSQMVPWWEYITNPFSYTRIPMSPIRTPEQLILSCKIFVREVRPSVCGSGPVVVWK